MKRSRRPKPPTTCAHCGKDDPPIDIYYAGEGWHGSCLTEMYGP